MTIAQFQINYPRDNGTDYKGRKYSAPTSRVINLREYGAVAATTSTGLINGATTTNLPNASTKTFTFGASVAPINGTLFNGVLDVPRNIVTTVTHGSAVVAMTIVYTGLDEYGVVISETHTIPAGGTTQTVNGTNAFKTVTSVAMTSAGNATTNTVNAGTGKVLGLPFYLSSKNALMTFQDGVPLTNSTVVVGDITKVNDDRGTWTPSATPNGTITFAVWMVVNDQRPLTEYNV